MEHYNIDKQVERALTREPDFKLPNGFADRLVSMIEEARKKEQKWEIFLMGFAGFLFLIALIVVFVLTDFKLDLTGVSFLSRYFGLMVFGILFIVLLHVVDKKVIHKTQGS
jgi:hypothetical protein